MVVLGNEWDDILKDEFKKEYYLKLRGFLKKSFGNMSSPNLNKIKIFYQLRDS